MLLLLFRPIFCHYFDAEFIPLTLSDANSKHFSLLRLFSFFSFLFQLHFLPLPPCDAHVVFVHLRRLNLDFSD